MNRRVISANPYLPDGEASQTLERHPGECITLLSYLDLPQGTHTQGPKCKGGME